MDLLSRIENRLRAKEIDSPLYDLHPELVYRVPIFRSTVDDLEGQSASPTYQTNVGFYASQVWVQKAIKVIKDNLGTLPLVVMRGKGEKETPVDNHPLLELLDNPNPEMSGPDLWGEWSTNMLLAGEMGIELVRGASDKRLPLQLWPRQPDTIWVRVENYRYRRVERYKIDDGAGDPYFLDPEEMIFFKFYNPEQIFRGLAPITAVRTGVIIDQLAQAWARLFFKNSARPDWALVAPQGITKGEKEDLYIQIDEKAGGRNAHRPFILEEGVTDIKTLSFPPKDMEWIEQRKLSRDEIGAIFGVPDEIMGYGRDTYENFATAERVLWTLTIQPLASFRDAVLTRFFRGIKQLGTDERVDTDFTEISALQEDISAKIEQFQGLVQNGWPANRAIEYLNIDTDPLPGGDVGYIPFGMTPLGVSPIGRESLSAMPMTKAIPPFGSPAHDAMWKQHQARIDDPVQAMQRKLKRYFQEQQNDVARRLRSSRILGRGKFNTKQDVPPIDELLDLVEWIDRFIELFRADIEQAVGIVGDDEMSRLAVEFAFDLDNSLVQQGVDYIVRGVADKVNRTTYDGLLQLIGEAEVAGEGIPAIQERLSAFFGDRKSDYQTERIARTTMTGAANFASMESWDQSGVVDGKAWLSALLPKRTRPDHAAAHGQVVPLRGHFLVGNEYLEHPGDPNGSAGNVINCLCFMVAQVRE